MKRLTGVFVAAAVVWMVSTGSVTGAENAGASAPGAASATASGPAGRQEALAKVLAMPLVPAETVLQEMKGFVEPRIVWMPEVKSAAEWTEAASSLREAVLERVVFRGEAARWRELPTRPEWLDTIAGGEGYTIRKLRFEAVPGLWIPALIYMPTRIEGKVPVVLNVNGHDGRGKAIPYKQIRCINQAKRGMIAMNLEWLGMGQLRTEGLNHYRMNQLDLCGTSGLAPFYLSMKRALDILLSLPEADPQRVAVAGLSGGGWQTITISSLDERVTLANPVAGYSSFFTRAQYIEDLGDSEQTPSDLAAVADYLHLTAMRAPRPTLLTYNAKDDCCFRADHALPPLLEGAGPIYALYGKPDALRSHVNEDPGTHNFEQDNREALYKMLGDFFYAGESFDGHEIACDTEVKSAEELNVPLPEKNADFHTLALGLMRGLPRRGEVPASPAAREDWRKEQRTALRQIVRFRAYDVKGQAAAGQTAGGVKVVPWTLRLGGDWTIAAVEVVHAGQTVKGTCVLIGDAGRAKLAGEVDRWLTTGYRVVAVDPFLFGESGIADRGFLYALLMAATGERPLGVQAGQVAAAVKWSVEVFGGKPVTLAAVGRRTSIIALVAAVVDPTRVEAVELTRPMSSLKQVIEENLSVQEGPEMFCFGLLDRFDLADMVELIGREKVRVREIDKQRRVEN